MCEPAPSAIKEMMTAAILFLALCPAAIFAKSITAGKFAAICISNLTIAVSCIGKFNEGNLVPLAECEMILTEEQKSGIADEKYRWPNATVFYKLEDKFGNLNLKFLRRNFDGLQKLISKKLRRCSDRPCFKVYYRGGDCRVPRQNLH